LSALLCAWPHTSRLERTGRAPRFRLRVQHFRYVSGARSFYLARGGGGRAGGGLGGVAPRNPTFSKQRVVCVDTERGKPCGPAVPRSSALHVTRNGAHTPGRSWKRSGAFDAVWPLAWRNPETCRSAGRRVRNVLLVRYPHKELVLFADPLVFWVPPIPYRKNQYEVDNHQPVPV
jgi:hypothetical protein